MQRDGGHLQWRAVGINRGLDGDSTDESAWRDSRDLAVGDRDLMRCCTPGFDEVVLETRLVTEPEVERIPIILRAAPTPQPERMAYIGIAACGCVTFAMVIGHDSAAAEAHELAGARKTGRVIDRVTVEEAQARFTFGCNHKERAA